MTAAPSEAVNIHATAMIVGEKGLLLRGPSGAGKSGLALTLIEMTRARGDFAELVGDDRVAIERRDDRLVARPHPAIAGVIESRGHGLLHVANEPACVLRAVIDLCGPGELPPRLPQTCENFTEIARVRLPRLSVLGSDAHAWRRILTFIQYDTTF